MWFAVRDFLMTRISWRQVIAGFLSGFLVSPYVRPDVHTKHVETVRHSETQQTQQTRDRCVCGCVIPAKTSFHGPDNTPKAAESVPILIVPEPERR